MSLLLHLLLEHSAKIVKYCCHILTVATSKGSADPSGNESPIPTQWIIIAIVLVGVLLIVSAVMFVWYRRRKARRVAGRFSLWLLNDS